MDFAHITTCLESWASLVGLDVDDNTIGSYYNKQNLERLNKCSELDSTGVTTWLLLKSIIQDKLQNTSATLKQIIDGEVDEEIDQWRKLWVALNRDEDQQEINEFSQTIIEALRHYNLDDDETISLVSENASLAELRYSALHNMDTLVHMQFSHGEPDKEKPKYHDSVLSVKNPHDLITILPHIPSGISLVMINADRVSFSYFAFAVRNGGTITFITDCPDDPHPNYRNMTRNDRHMEKRLESTYFPYDILNIEYDHSGHPIVNSSIDKSIIRAGIDVFCVASLKELEAESKVWILLMFDLIKKKYFDENHKIDEICHTATSVVQGIGHEPGNREVAINFTKSQKLLTAADIEDQEWDHDYKNKNQWLLDRYKNRVPDAIYNVVEDGDDVKLIGHDGPVAVPDVVFSPDLKSIDINAIGTADKLLADRKWAGRYNQALVVDAYAKEEFEERRDSIIKWYNETINQDLLFDFIIAGSCKVEKKRTKANVFDHEIEEDIMIGPKWYKTGSPSYWRYGFGQTATVQGPEIGSYYTCCKENNRARVFVWFHPKTAKGIAGLLGLKINDLPDVLQYWTLEEEYTGNPILDRIDPMNWVCKNPWHDIKFSIRVCLSKNGFNNIFRERGLKPPKLTPESA